MKRSKLLALTLVVALMLVGAGYAAWTDRINVTSVIETGEFKVSLGSPWSWLYVTDQGTERFVNAEQDNAYIVGRKDPTITDNSVEFNFKNLYPGTRAWTQWYATNIGSINAIVDDINVDIESTGGEVIENNMIVNGIIQKRVNKDTSTAVTLGSIAPNTTLSGLEDELNRILKGVELKPNEVLFFGDKVVEGDEAAASYISFIIPTTLTGDDGENETVEIKITMDFVQYNLYDATNPQQN